MIGKEKDHEITIFNSYNDPKLCYGRTDTSGGLGVSTRQCNDFLNTVCSSRTWVELNVIHWGHIADNRAQVVGSTSRITRFWLHWWGPTLNSSPVDDLSPSGSHQPLCCPVIDLELGDVLIDARRRKWSCAGETFALYDVAHQLLKEQAMKRWKNKVTCLTFGPLFKHSRDATISYGHMTSMSWNPNYFTTASGFTVQERKPQRWPKGSGLRAWRCSKNSYKSERKIIVLWNVY